MKRTVVRSLMVLAAVSLVVGLGFAGSPLAHAVPGSSGKLCDNQGSGSCLTFNGDDTQITMEGSGSATSLTKVADNICGGSNQVTGNCPFTLGLGLNDEFINDRIVYLTGGTHCVGVSVAQYIAVEHYCPGSSNNTTGDEWVEDGTYGLVNVAESNYMGGTYRIGETVCASGGTGSIATLYGAYQGSQCQWSF